MPAPTPQPTRPQVWQLVPAPTTYAHTPAVPTPRPTEPRYVQPTAPMAVAPTPKPLSAPKPTYPLAVAPVNVECNEVGAPCGCPVGTLGTCTITCGGQDGCKDSTIE